MLVITTTVILVAAIMSVTLALVIAGVIILRDAAGTEVTDTTVALDLVFNLLMVELESASSVSSDGNLPQDR